MPALPAAFATGLLLPPIRRREDLGWLAELRGYKVRCASESLLGGAPCEYPEYREYSPMAARGPPWVAPGLTARVVPAVPAL